MGKTVSIDLGDRLTAFVDTQVAEGRYDSPNEVVRASVRLLEEREMHLNALRAALVAGEESGLAVEFDFDEFLAKKRAAAGG